LREKNAQQEWHACPECCRRSDGADCPSAGPLWQQLQPRWSSLGILRKRNGESPALAMLVAAHLQYYFFGVMLQILMMHSVIVFAPTAMN
jgi:hypothetical protein